MLRLYLTQLSNRTTHNYKYKKSFIIINLTTQGCNIKITEQMDKWLIQF